MSESEFHVSQIGRRTKYYPDGSFETHGSFGTWMRIFQGMSKAQLLRYELERAKKEGLPPALAIDMVNYYDDNKGFCVRGLNMRAMMEAGMVEDSNSLRGTKLLWCTPGRRIPASQMLRALSLSFVHGHAWAGATATIRPFAAAGLITVEGLHAYAAWLDEHDHGVFGGIFEPVMVNNAFVHTTGTGRLSWYIGAQSARLVVSRPGPTPVLEAVVTGAQELAVYRLNPGTDVEARHLDTLVDALLCIDMPVRDVLQAIRYNILPADKTRWMLDTTLVTVCEEQAAAEERELAATPMAPGRPFATLGDKLRDKLSQLSL